MGREGTKEFRNRPRTQGIGDSQRHSLGDPVTQTSALTQAVGHSWSKTESLGDTDTV